MFTGKNRITDLLEYNPQLILMLPRFGIKLGFGEKRVDEICKEYGVPTDMFILLCNVYAYDDYMPSENEIRSIDGECLVKYLIASHDYYINHRMKHINKHIEKIANEVGEIGKVLMSFFEEYQNDVHKHFMQEETVLFPFILQTKDKQKKMTAKEITESHNDLGDKLSDITNIIIKHLPGDILPNERIGVWFDIVQITKDLKKHEMVEEKILMPYVKWTKGEL